MTVSRSYTPVAPATRSIDFSTVQNSGKYWNLLVHKTKNGKAVRIANRIGEQNVFISLDKVDSLITALKEIKDSGAKLSTDSRALPYNR